jgi:hypothetical protein
MNPATVDQILHTNAPLQNPDGTENQQGVEAINTLGAQLAQLFAPPAPPTGARRRRRTYRRRRSDVRRVR